MSYQHPCRDSACSPGAWRRKSAGEESWEHGAPNTGTEGELGKGCVLQVDSVECFPPNVQILHLSSETMSSSGNGVKDGRDGLTASKLCGCMGQSEWV